MTRMSPGSARPGARPAKPAGKTLGRARIVARREQGMVATEIAKAVGSKEGTSTSAQGRRAEDDPVVFLADERVTPTLSSDAKCNTRRH